MIEAVLVLAGVASVGAGASLGFIAGARRAATKTGAWAEQRASALVAQRDAAEKRALEAQRESARLKALSLAGEALSAEPVYSGRPSPRDAEELARLVRGLVFIDDVVLSDRTGLPLTREENRASADLSALAPLVVDVARRLVLSGLPVTQVDLETFGAEHVCARPLEGRAEGVVLLVRTTSQPANPLAIDAVAQAAARGGAFVPGSPSRAASGTTDRVGEADSHVAGAYPLLERELGRDVRAIMLCADGLPLFSAAKDGPSAATRKTLAAELHRVQARCADTLRATGIARLEVRLRGGDLATWSSLGPRSRLSVVTVGSYDARSGARLDRLVGALRRVAFGGDRAVATAGGPR
ncbi:MAG: hypothetical protein JST00_08600 [Deltaproteobacteria bacterium]|nr:hypothetical protein [Deltaproteobacteria bacterium]